MPRYVKKCPECGYPNPEDAEVCEIDGEFLVFAEAQIDDAEAVDPAHDDSQVSEADRQVAREQKTRVFAGRTNRNPGRTSCRATRIQEEGQKILRLVSEHDGHEYRIKNGDTLGRDHSTSEADVGLNQEPGMDYVHRSHCRFDHIDGHWRITAIDQGKRGREFNNGTSVSDRALAPGDSRTLSEGDRITLAGRVALQVYPDNL